MSKSKTTKGVASALGIDAFLTRAFAEDGDRTLTIQRAPDDFWYRFSFNDEWSYDGDYLTYDDGDRTVYVDATKDDWDIDTDGGMRLVLKNNPNYPFYNRLDSLFCLLGLRDFMELLDTNDAPDGTSVFVCK